MGRAGELDRRIRIDRAISSQDATGGETGDGFVPLAHVWAKRTDMSVAEAMKADETQASRVTLFKVRSSELTRSVVPTDRIHLRGANYEITGTKETNEGRNNYLEFTTIVAEDSSNA